jgi:hypothetical protein
MVGSIATLAIEVAAARERTAIGFVQPRGLVSSRQER